MLRAITADQSRSIETRAVQAGEMNLFELMSRAGEALAAECMAQLPESPRVAIACGPGNNGGDGWVCASVLLRAGLDVVVFSAVDVEQLKAEASRAATAAVSQGVRWHLAKGALTAEELAKFPMVVDALLGTGSRLPLTEDIASLCQAINDSGSFVLAADVPTGVSSDGGSVDPRAVMADATLTFTAPKLGLVTHPAAVHAGEVVVADIGLGAYLEALDAPQLWQSEDFSAVLPRPACDAHKNERGRVLIVAGSGRFPGAAILAARGAMRMGAGYVMLAVPEPVASIAQAHLLAAPVIGLPSSRARSFSSAAAGVVMQLSADFDAVVLGPGMTLADGAVATARSLCAELKTPLVIDADGLNALVDARDLLESRQGVTVLTPHAGELARLLNLSAAEVQSDRLAAARALCGPNCTVLLKGAGSIASDLGRQVIISAGTPALATAGTGDVLAGIVGALLAQRVPPLEAAALGAHLHAVAGEYAAEELTPLCVTAEDLPDYLPRAVAEVL